MAQAAQYAPDYEIELIEQVAEYYDDPLGFVLWAFPWGEPGQLEQHEGPDWWQIDLLESVRNHVQTNPLGIYQDATASGHGTGKGQRLDANVLTPRGMVRWGDLRPGDHVFGPDGKPTRIVATRRYRQQHYRVTFDDRSSTIVSEEHEWAVRGRQERRKGIPAGDTSETLDGWRIMETREFIEAGVKRPNGGAMARQWEIPTASPVEMPEADQAIHPYIMGLWLGDGTVRLPAYCKPYQEIKTRVELVCDYRLHTAADGMLQRAQGINSKLTDPVFECKSHERYIPEQYKYASVDQRMELFRGLMDSDGEVHKSGSIGYSSASRQLAEDVIWLARSLGCKAMMQPTVKQPSYQDNSGKQIAGRPSYRVTINAPFNPFTIKHRRDAYKPSERRYLVRWIDSIEPVEVYDGMCIEVEHPTSLYLANDFIVTHNSALSSWIILWAMSTRPHLNGIVTANTFPQLKTKTWRELAVWHKRAINNHWFQWTETKFFHREHPETWFTAPIANTEHNSEAFAGQHAEHSIIIYDEASAIPDKIWEVSSGVKDPRTMWFVFGNPTQNSGRFRECFGRQKHRWVHRHVDSRTCKMPNKEELQKEVDEYGEDSDYVRIRIRGLFPRIGDQQLISVEIAENAVRRTVDVPLGTPKILTVDVARFGTDQSVIGRVHGRKLEPLLKFRGLDTMQLAARVAHEIDKNQPDVVLVDGVGVGGGVVDRLRLLGYEVIEVNAGAEPEPQNKDKFLNKRMEMWFRMREWLENADIPDDRELVDDLTSIIYSYDNKMRMVLEKKEDMKKRGLSSPDCGDALALAFAYPTPPVRESGRSYEPEYVGDY